MVSPARNSFRGVDFDGFATRQGDLGALHRTEIPHMLHDALEGAAAGRANQHVRSPHEQF
jgi:hypothetical protein